MYRLSTILALACVLPVVVTSAGCWRDSAAARDAERERTSQDRMARDETAIRAASAGWSKAAQSKDLEKALTFFTDNAIMLSPRSPAVQGKENIRKVWQQMLALPGPGKPRVKLQAHVVITVRFS
jgi:hypothetical protein